MPTPSFPKMCSKELRALANTALQGTLRDKAAQRP